MTQTIDLTGGEAKIIGNRGDSHLFRLNNPVDQEIIGPTGEYEADFISYLGSDPVPVDLDTSEVATGVLSFPVTISNGVYRVRRTNPQRTILTIEIEEAS